MGYSNFHIITCLTKYPRFFSGPWDNWWLLHITDVERFRACLSGHLDCGVFRHVLDGFITIIHQISKSTTSVRRGLQRFRVLISTCDRVLQSYVYVVLWARYSRKSTHSPPIGSQKYLSVSWRTLVGWSLILAGIHFSYFRLFGEHYSVGIIIDSRYVILVNPKIRWRGNVPLGPRQPLFHLIPGKYICQYYQVAYSAQSIDMLVPQRS